MLHYVDAVHSLDCALVLTEDLLNADDGICRFALARGHDLWAVPPALVEAIRLAAGLATASRVATMIAPLTTAPNCPCCTRTHNDSTLKENQPPT